MFNLFKRKSVTAYHDREGVKEQQKPYELVLKKGILDYAIPRMKKLDIKYKKDKNKVQYICKYKIVYEIAEFTYAEFTNIHLKGSNFTFQFIKKIENEKNDKLGKAFDALEKEFGNQLAVDKLNECIDKENEKKTVEKESISLLAKISQKASKLPSPLLSLSSRKRKKRKSNKRRKSKITKSSSIKKRKAK